MKIMFLTDHFYPFRDATSNCVHELARQLKRNGNDVSVLSVVDDKQYMKISEVDNISTFWMYVPHRLTPKKLKQNYRYDKKEYLLILFLKGISKLCKTRYSKLGCDNLSVYFFSKAIRKYSYEIQPECIIAAFMPTELARACYKLKQKNKLGCKYFVYHTDEYIENYAYRKKGIEIRKKWLGQIYKEAAGIFMTPLMIDKYKKYYPQFCKKFMAIEFPLMKQKDITVTVVPWEAGGVHCLYCGTFYPQIRNPQYLFGIFSELVQDDIHLHLLLSGDFELEQYGLEELPQNIHIHPAMKPNETFYIMQKADVLVNIGNAFPNMLPSKIFDFFSAGRPIIHLAQIPECTSIPYMEKYPNMLIIRQYEENKISEQVKLVKEFALNSIYKENLKISELCQQYRECTPEFVTSVIEGKLTNI